MTTLDTMRRHRSWLKWSLGLVAVSFVIFYIPNCFDQGTALGTLAADADTIATVEGRDITAGEFRRTYQAQVQAYRNAYGGSMSEQLLKQLGIDQQILQQMVDERAALAEAARVGISAGDEEVRQRILSVPAFQENGAFIGEQRYQQLLRSQRPPMTAGEFEETVRRQIVLEKLRAAVTEWLSATDQEIEQEYRRRNDKVKLALVTFTAESFRKGVTATDAEVASYFEANKDTFTIGEKRKIRYLLVDIDALRAKVVVPAGEVERTYNANIDQYTTPEQVRASHILLKTEGKDEAAVKARAEALLKQARAGANFAELAKKNSEDETNASTGGDLDYFARGRMVAEFDQAAFAMQPGQLSDAPVKTQFGYHIIKVVDRKAATQRTLADVRQQLTDQLAYETATAQATSLADTISSEIRRPADLDKAALAHGLAVQESGLFSRDEPVLGLGSSPEATTRAFAMKIDEVAGPIRSSRGFVFEALAGPPQAPYVPKLGEVADRVRDVVITNKSLALSRQKAADIATRLKTAPDFERAAKAAGFEAKTTDLITRDAPLPDLGVTTAVGDIAFALPVGGVSGVVDTDTGAAVVKVVEKTQVTPTEWLATKDRFRDEFLSDRRNRFFSSYMEKAKLRMRIDINRETLQKTVG